MRDRIRSLTAISQIRDQALQERSSELTRMQSDLSRIHNIRKDLERARVEECGVTMIEALPYVGKFLGTIAVEDKKAAVAEAQVTRMIEVKREEVLSAWREVRSVNHVLGSLRDTIAVQAIRAENAATDERNIISYQRVRREVA